MASKGKNNKIIKFRKKKTVHVGVAIFMIIVIYLAVYTITFIRKPHLSIYEVRRESLAVESVAEGIIIREETVVTTDIAGKVNYYQRDGSRIKKHSMIYSINDSSIFSSLTASEDYQITEQDAIQIKRRIALFDKKYNDSDYSIIKEFKEDISGNIQQLIDLYMMDQLVAENGNNVSNNAIYSNKSGIISYKVDNYDNIQVKDITSSVFNKDNYVSSDLRGIGLVETGGKIYKLITSENWKIVVPIGKELYDLLSDRSTVNIRILEDNFELAVPVDIDRTEGEYYAILSFSNYMIRYKDYRFVEVEFIINSEIGLKIPTTSITKKDFYLVPLYCFTKGGNNNAEDGLTIRSVNENSNDYIFTFTPCVIYHNDGEFAYVDMGDFTFNTYVVVPDNVEAEKDIYRVTLVDELEGAYNVNKGFAVFRRIEVISYNDEYCIIKEGTSNGLALYDHIALDAATATEEKSIY